MIKRNCGHPPATDPPPCRSELLDEPTGNLDSKNGEAVMELLRDLHRGGATICNVTHDAHYASFAERAVHLCDGGIVNQNGQQAYAEA